MRDLPTIRRFASPQAGLRTMAEKAPQAEALAASWIERLQPLGSRVYALRRRLATAAVALLAGLLLVHVMFGANGMIVYKNKKAEYQSLHAKVIKEQQENDLYTQSIHGMKTDQKAIEKEAREQLHYLRPGEYEYVPSAPANPPPPPTSNSAKK